MPEEPIQKESPIDIKNTELKVKPNQDIENKLKESLPTKTDENGQVKLDEEAIISMQIKNGIEGKIDPQRIFADIIAMDLSFSPQQSTQGEKVIPFPQTPVASEEQTRQAA